MNTLILAFFSLILCQEPDNITGVWYTPEKENKIEIKKDKNGYSGKVVWLLQPYDKKGQPLHDLRNPDALKRSRPIIGLEVLSVKLLNKNTYSGKVYDAKSGKTYKVKVIAKENQLEIHVQLGLFKYQEIWTRASV